MNKKFFFFGMVAVLGVSLSFLGCESAADGSNGAPGTIVLSGDATPEGIQYAVDSNAPVVFAGVVQSESGFVSIPAGRNVTLVGNGAYSVKSGKSAQLVLASSSSISAASTGKIAKGDGTLLIVAPEDVLTGTKIASDVPAESRVALQSGGVIDTSGNDIAVTGNITVSSSATSAVNILNSELTVNKNLYVIGSLKVSALLPAVVNILVVGDADVDTAPQTAAVKWNITGNLTASKTPTVNGAISVKGTSSFTEALIAGAFNANGKAAFTGAGSFSAAGSLDGGASFGGNVETSGGAVVTVSGGAAEFAAGNTLKGYMSADSVTLAGALNIVSGSLATGGQILLTNSTSIVLGNGSTTGGGIEFTAAGRLTSANFELSGAGSLLNDTTANGGTSVTFANTGITKGAGNGTLSIVFSDQTYLAFKDDSTISGINLDVSDGGSISIEGASKKLTLTGGGSITAAVAEGTLGAANLYVITNAAGSLVVGTYGVNVDSGSVGAGSYGTFAQDVNFIHGGIYIMKSGTSSAFGLANAANAVNGDGAAGSLVVFTANN
jgi:hypothetical protein